jgi:transaldolase / glucose-6-phosphate isomerase
MKDSFQSLLNCGQSVWLDHLSRSLITSGDLKQLIEQDCVRGLTSNPSIFEKAIVENGEYRAVLEDPKSQGMDSKTLYEQIAVHDIQDAADILQSVYVDTKRRDGYVSLEVSPELAHDTQGSIDEARRLWRIVARENLMIKVPGTLEGFPAVQQLISEGINVNVTLLFSQKACEQAASAYFGGLESLVRQGGDPGKVASVASFFVSRIDTAVDNWIAQRMVDSHNVAEHVMLRSLPGKTAIASAKIAYQNHLVICRRDRWQNLSRLGAQAQRLLWASTGTKNPTYRDVVYVEKLVGPETVNTIPLATLDAFRDHGFVRTTLTENVEEASDILRMAEAIGIPFKEITDRLLDDGVKQFAEAYKKLLEATNRSGTVIDFNPDTFLGTHAAQGNLRWPASFRKLITPIH